MSETVLETHELSIWDRRKLNDIMSKIWEEVETAQYMLEHSKVLDVLGESFKKDLDYYSRAVFVLLNSIDTDIIGYLNTLREKVNSDEWRYKVERRNFIDVLDEIIADRTKSYNKLKETGRRIKKTDSENVRYAIMTYRSAAKMVGKEIEVLNRLRKRLVYKQGILG